MWSTTGSHPSPLNVAVFGKTPRMGDFLRVGSGGPAGEALEQWVEQGLGMAEARRNNYWPSAYAVGQTYAFVFRPPRSTGSKEALVGVIKPSIDAVGRRFPLVVYSTALPRASVPWPHMLPIALGDFFDAAATLLLEADNVTGIADMQAAMRHVPMPRLVDADRSAQEYEAWAAATPLSQAWNVVYGGEQAMSVPRSVHTILEAVAPFRGEEQPATKLGLRLPLGPGGVAAAAFWLDTVRRLARTPAEVRTCFWCFDGNVGCALVQLGDTPSGSLGELWLPDPNSEYLCDLVGPTSVDVGRFLGKLPPHVAEVLQSPNALVRDFLDRLTV
ncbi:MAG: type VI secretion system-associated protein TagF [Polyangiaceae bacterium]|jgi:type VI secretion system ImpM family protein